MLSPEHAKQPSDEQIVAASLETVRERDEYKRYASEFWSLYSNRFNDDSLDESTAARLHETAETAWPSGQLTGWLEHHFVELALNDKQLGMLARELLLDFAYLILDINYFNSLDYTSLDEPKSLPTRPGDWSLKDALEEEKEKKQDT